MDVVQSCEQVVDDARRVIASVRPYERSRKTPCAGWDVSALIYHMIGVCARYTAALQEASGGGDSTPDVGFDVSAAYVEISDAVLKEWRMPGALDKTITLRIGQIPATFGVRLFITDQLLHTWDLAKALGRPFTMPEDLSEELLGFMKERLTPDLRGPGKAFGYAVACPDDAPVQDRLVAFSGRQP